MRTKGSRTECTLRNDARLIAGIGAVVSHAAGRAGLVDCAQGEFAAATEEACRATLATLHDVCKRDLTVQLAVVDFPGRVEVTIEPAATGNGRRLFHMRAAAHAVECVCQTLERKGVDRALCETHPHSFRMKLIKYSHEPKSATGD